MVMYSQRLLFYLKMVVGTCEGRQGNLGLSLCWVISVSVVIKKTECATCYTSGGEVKVLEEYIAPLSSPTCIVMHGTTHVVGILRRTFCVGELSLCMCGEENVWIAVEQTLGFVQIGYLWPLVFKR